METILESLLKQLKPYFDEGLRKRDSEIYLYDEELGDQASCCITGQTAGFYAAYAARFGGKAYSTAEQLTDHAAARQLSNGAFEQPYYVRKGESGTVDIAEIGAVANALFHIHKRTGSEAAKTTLLRSADYLLGQVAKENPGAVYKNPNAMTHDVLNGDIYAAHTFGRAFELSGSPSYRLKAEEIVKHVLDRFGKHSAGWWPYTELWDGTIGMGNSVSYQATIIAFANTLLPLLPVELAESWRQVEREAGTTMIEAMKSGPDDFNEAPWWSRDWNNVWEIPLALFRLRHLEPFQSLLTARLEAAEQALQTQGISLFQPKVKHDDPERSPVTTTFRKAATFGGIISSMVLDSSSQGGDGR